MAGEITSNINATVANPTAGLTTSDGYTNPSGILGKDDFLKLLLTELKYQDPTSPMETEKMLSQTADLTVVEAQNSMKSSIESLAAQMKTTSSYSMVDAVGKIADTGNDSIKFSFQGEPTDVDVFFDEVPLSGNFKVYDATGNLVRNIPLTESNINNLTTNTIETFTWDGEDESGIPVDSGTYSIEVEYMGATSHETKKTKPGQYPIESIKFSNGEPQLKLSDDYYTIDQIAEIKTSL